jgi:hypothetical protein
MQRGRGRAGGHAGGCAVVEDLSQVAELNPKRLAVQEQSVPGVEQIEPPRRLGARR